MTGLDVHEKQDPYKRALLIINPTSGKMKAKTGMAEILDTLTACHVLPAVHITQSVRDARKVAAQLGGTFPLVIACGGDGTLNEVISGILDGGHQTPIGYIPCGTTNDYANSLNIPRELAEASANAALGNSVLQDIGLFGEDRYFTYIASFGMLSAVSYDTPQAMKNIFGHLAYLIEGAKSIADIKSYHIQIEADGFQAAGDYLFGAVTNTTSIAGIFKFSPEQVDLHDGMHEAIFIRQPKSLAELNRILTALRTQTPDSELFDCFRTGKICVRSAVPIAWTTDGEFAGETTSALISNLPNAVSIKLPEPLL